MAFGMYQMRHPGLGAKSAKWSSRLAEGSFTGSLALLYSST